jgi:hypothetical protein
MTLFCRRNGRVGIGYYPTIKGGNDLISRREVEKLANLKSATGFRHLRDIRSLFFRVGRLVVQDENRQCQFIYLSSRSTASAMAFISLIKRANFSGLSD